MNARPVIPGRPEEARLAALADYAALDTPAESDFDDIAFVASHICRAPVALVSLVDRDRQWFKARVGFEPCETPLGSSVCAHALGQTEILSIPDLTLDPRTRDNPLVTDEPKIRFYAGAPLVTPGGVAIGSLCVIDTTPRPGGLDAEQSRTLTALARQVIGQFELRKALRDVAAAAERETAVLRESDARSRLAQKAGRVGTFELDVETGLMLVSAETCRLFGLPVAPSFAASDFEALVLPDDAGVISSDASRRNGVAAPDVEYRIRRADDGLVRWIARRAEFVSDSSGRPLRLFGTVHDVTERRSVQDQQAALLRLGEALRDGQDGAEMARIAAETLGATLGAASAGYATFSADGEVVSDAQTWAAPGHTAITLRQRVGDHDAYVADLRRGEMVVVGDTRQDERTRANAAALSAAGVLAFVGCPLMRRERCIGAVYVIDAAVRPWSDQEVAFVRAVADRTFAAVGRVQAEADQRILNQELSHRLKNTLAMVQAIAAQTLRAVPEREPVMVFEKRMLALATAHEVLLTGTWSEAPLATVATSVLRAFGRPEAVEVAGPDLSLGPRATLSISLLLHELATNAIKHGSLSVETGRVSLTWEVRETADGPELVVRWRERGGPPAMEPNRKGFGSRLIQMGLVGTGGVELRYNTYGFEAEMRAPLAQVQLS